SEKLSAAIHARSFAELKEKRNRMRWYMGPLTINAYYSAEDNQFVMPVGILQYPFYDPNLSEITNLGAVGAVIGHELGHGIDDQGAQMDADGKLRQWMSDKDVKNFQSRGKKFISQFDKAGHNGKLTLGENIGDLTGVTFAYRAAFPEGKGTVQQKKDFFTQYARVWCGVQRPKFTEQRLKTDPHSLGWARVNEQVKNQPAFAEAFSCKKGDKMVLDPKDIVKIW
ncbi:MAG: M13 family peptidase, partial [Proteobacteria bacterium]